MSNLKKKLNGNKGFTLVEMLIVVAIIAILIAISIPLVNSALEKSKHAADAANERAAKAVMTITNLDGKLEADGVYVYNAKSGEIEKVSGASTITGGPSDADFTKNPVYGKHKKHAYIFAKMSGDEVLLKWTESGTSASTAPTISDDKGLCGNNEAREDHTK